MRSLVFILVFASSFAFSAENTISLAVKDASIRFTLGATMHTVEGRASLRSGNLRFDEETGLLDGRVVIDARSLTTDNSLRDANMHEDVLESDRFPEITFRASRFREMGRDGNRRRVRVEGEVDIHGSAHPLSFPAEVLVEQRDFRIEAKFTLPYVKWGMKDVSFFPLYVDDFVTVTVNVAGKLDRPLEGKRPL